MKENLERTVTGKLDPNFAKDGVLYFPLPEIVGNVPSAVLALSHNKLLTVIGPLVAGAPISVARLNEDGTLDTEFGENKHGFVEVFLKNNPVIYVFGISPLTNGGWLIVGQYLFIGDSDVITGSGFYIVRQHPDGQLDRSFGEGGIRYIDHQDIGRPEDTGVAVITHQSGRNNAEGGRVATSKMSVAAAEQADGKIVLVSNVATGFMTQKGIVLSFNSDGSTNKDFNGGFAIVDLPGIEHESNSGSAVSLQADGKVLVGGHYSDGSMNILGAYLVRFDAEGKVDTGFNEGHTATIPHIGWIDIQAITVRESDGRIVAVGDVRRGGGHNGLIFVLNASGTPNLVFNGGKPLFSEFVPEGLGWWHVSQVDGSIIVAGNTGKGFVTEDLTAVTARYRADGSLDTTFNGKGYTIFNEDHVYEGTYDMTLMADGRIVVCGSLSKDAEPFPAVTGGWILRYI
ncbi:hypothetical protein [Pseudomonas sp.]|jgi:uncharacterized delta-60 repeat protein|uniref:hypothetical protein n=1 Tax=Pseudomonas sp. TaxID=306 RepID=UPI00326358AD